MNKEVSKFNASMIKFWNLSVSADYRLAGSFAKSRDSWYDMWVQHKDRVYLERAAQSEQHRLRHLASVKSAVFTKALVKGAL